VVCWVGWVVEGELTHFSLQLFPLSPRVILLILIDVEVVEVLIFVVRYFVRECASNI